jgi:hypothetical protein
MQIDTETMNEIDGGCLCGAVRYRVRGAPLYSVICHCSSCRKASAAPSVAWLTFARDSFRIVSGTPCGFASSPGVLRTFCARCGSQLTYGSERRPTRVDVTTASLDDPAVFPPLQEVWLADRLPWTLIDPEREQFSDGGE